MPMEQQQKREWRDVYRATNQMSDSPGQLYSLYLISTHHKSVKKDLFPCPVYDKEASGTLTWVFI